MEGLPKNTQEPEDNRAIELMHEMIERNFTPKHEPRSQEELQAAWDERKAQESQKFDPKNLEQKELFD